MGLLQRLAQQWCQPFFRKEARFFSNHATTGMLTHIPAQERPTLNTIKEKLRDIQEGIKNHSTLSYSDKVKLSTEAQRLSEFELGRFLIANRGALSGWWTYYCILGYKKHPITNPVERFLLEESPVILATRERFGHFQTIMRQVIKEHCHIASAVNVASIPGGMAADLLTLDLAVDLDHCQLRFVSIDLDSSVTTLANQLAAEVGCKIPMEYRCEDAWSLTAKNEFDLVVSNGLNIYVPQREKVIALYEGLLKTLKPGGTLITSALTPPPHRSEAGEWNHHKIDPVALARQAGIFAHILQATWSNFCTTEEMLMRLTEAGMVDVQVIPDSRNIFPTFVGRKA